MSASIDISQVPALTPPAGVTPNFVNPETLAPLARYTICIATISMVVLLFLRLCVRLRVTHIPGAPTIVSTFTMVLQIVTDCWFATRKHVEL